MHMLRIDLIAISGESFGPWRMGMDRKFLACVTPPTWRCVFSRRSFLHGPHRLGPPGKQGRGRGSPPGLSDLVGFRTTESGCTPGKVTRLSGADRRSAAAGRARGVPLQHPSTPRRHVTTRPPRTPPREAVAWAVRDAAEGVILLGWQIRSSRRRRIAGFPSPRRPSRIEDSRRPDRSRPEPSGSGYL